MNTTHWVRVVFTGASVLAFLACNSHTPRESAPDLVAVSAVRVTKDSIAQSVAATGVYGPRDEISLAFKIPGVITSVAVDAGQTVRKGQLLASLDLREIDAQVSKAQVGVEKAERDAGRMKRLAADSVATTVQALDATALVTAARADVALATVNREYATIIAPEAGVVLERVLNAGTTVAAGSPVLRLGGNARGSVLHAGLTDRDALRVHVGDHATVTFDALPSRTFAARLTLVGKTSNAGTGTYTVEITLQNGEALPAGLIGRVEIATSAHTVASMIPIDALLEADADSATVYELTTGSEPIATARRVHIVQIANDRVAVTGLSDNANIVTAGAPYVTAGARVHVVTVATLTSSAGGSAH